VAKTDEAAYAAVEAELRRNPDSPQDVLLAKATEASPGIARLSPREFNARYPLQIKRKILRESGGGAPRKRPAGGKSLAAPDKRLAVKFQDDEYPSVPIQPPSKTILSSLIQCPVTPPW
jgi:hypothetical protein